MTILDFIIIVLYMFMMFGLGLVARTKIKSVDDYLLGGHRFNTFALVGTIMATLIGAGLTLGIAGSVYQHGAGVIWNYLGFGVGLVVFAFMVKRLRGTGKRTMAEVIAGEFGNLPRFFVAIIVVFYCTGIVSLCVTGMARLLTYLGEPLGISITTAVVITSIITTIYTALGGLYSVVWTDVVQFVIMFLVVVVIGPIMAIATAGGIGTMQTALASQHLSLFNPFQGTTFTYAITSFLLIFLSVPSDPTTPQRGLAAKDVNTAKKAFLFVSIPVVLYGVGLLFIGAGSMTVMPDLKETYGTTEAAFPIFIMKYYPTGLAGFGIAGLIAAIMSTISAMLLVGASHLVYDIGQCLFPQTKDETFNKILPWAVIVIGVIVTYAALQIESLLNVMYFVFSLIGSALMWPFIFTLYWKGATKWGITAGVVLGAISCLYMQIRGILGPGGDPVYLSMAISVASIVIGSLRDPNKRVRQLQDAQEGI
ncbi:sodium:solute symporter family protein [Candidatus Formimonas warabiya]|uniref:Sodium:solute symporter family protein n=1 Tax=Formimonas warabiya TaxID=1761012 RepID=A0A3G1KV25_FORW1|nr:sodium:solute symporter family protein [Candidatus Formimonas warabiya]ATW26292.1 hypothetical protein DCMF_17355 [Candidatus Formimonas warabiya]